MLITINNVQQINALKLLWLHVGIDHLKKKKRNQNILQYMTKDIYFMSKTKGT